MELILILLCFTSMVATAKLPFLPPVYQTREEFVKSAKEPIKEINVQEISQALGSQTVEALTDSKDVLRRLSEQTPVYTTPDLSIRDKEAAMSKRAENTVLDRPSIETINRPYSQFLYGGDIMLSPKHRAILEKVVADQGSKSIIIRNKRGAPVITNDKWPKGTPISYSFNSSIDAATRTLIRAAAAKISANTCIDYQENGPGANYLHFIKGTGCWSYLGMEGGKQEISIGANCDTIGIISHEMTHALSIDHTQNRKDRDQYVSLNIGAINSSTLHNFNKLTDSENDNFGVTYDYGSDMHYGAFSFSINGQAVLVTSDPNWGNTMGQRKYLTFSDYKLINLLYNCSSSCPKQMVCQNGGYPHPRDCNKCVCNDFYTGTNCETPRLTMNIPSIGRTMYSQEYDPPLYASGSNNNWDLFGKDSVKIIKAPEGKRIKVSFDKLFVAYGQLPCYSGCPFNGVEIVEGDNFGSMGKIFCCSKDEGYSFISKTNVIGYKAYASPGMPFDATVTYTVV